MPPYILTILTLCSSTPRIAVICHFRDKRIFNKAMFKQLRKVISIVILAVFITSSVRSPAYAQMASVDLMPFMPKPGVMVHLSPEFTPAYLKGIVIHPENALKFDFIIYKGDKPLMESQKKVEYTKLTKYFLASLAIPDDDQWVNLSPYEKDRIIKEDFGRTEMGRDLLVQDYMLKQITASLIYPEDNLGRKFWDRVYSEARQQYGTTSIPVNTFNKVWIIPDDAEIYEKDNTAYVLKSHLKVMLEEDYLSLKKHNGIILTPSKVNALGSKIVREIVLPALEREVNEGKNFASLRQIYSGVLLAAWYKRALKQSFLSRIYANKAKVKGVDQDPKNNEIIYRQYLKAYKKGVFNFIKEDVDKYTNETIPRKYFSGGNVFFSSKKNGIGADFGQVVHISTQVTAEQKLDMEMDSNAEDYASIAAVDAQRPATANFLESAALLSAQVMPSIIDTPYVDLGDEVKRRAWDVGQFLSDLPFQSFLNGATLDAFGSVTINRDPTVARKTGPRSLGHREMLNGQDPYSFFSSEAEIFESSLRAINALQPSGDFLTRSRGVMTYHVSNGKGGFKKIRVTLQPYHGVPHVGYNVFIALEFLVPDARYEEEIEPNPNEFFSLFLYALGEAGEPKLSAIHAAFVKNSFEYRSKNSTEIDRPAFYILDEGNAADLEKVVDAQARDSYVKQQVVSGAVKAESNIIGGSSSYTISFPTIVRATRAGNIQEAIMSLPAEWSAMEFKGAGDENKIVTINGHSLVVEIINDRPCIDLTFVLRQELQSKGAVNQLALQVSSKLSLPAVKIYITRDGAMQTSTVRTGVVNQPSLEGLTPRQREIVKNSAQRLAKAPRMYDVKPTREFIRLGVGTENFRDHSLGYYANGADYRGPGNYLDFDEFKKIVSGIGMGTYADRLRGVVAYHTQAILESKAAAVTKFFTKTILLRKTPKTHMLNLFIQPCNGVPTEDSGEGANRNAYIIMNFELDTAEYNEQMADLREFPSLLIYVFQASNDPFFNQVDKGFIREGMNFEAKPGKKQINHASFYEPFTVNENRNEKDREVLQRVAAARKNDAEQIAGMQTSFFQAPELPEVRPGTTAPQAVPLTPVLPAPVISPVLTASAQDQITTNYQLQQRIQSHTLVSVTYNSIVSGKVSEDKKESVIGIIISGSIVDEGPMKGQIHLVIQPIQTFKQEDRISLELLSKDEDVPVDHMTYFDGSRAIIKDVAMKVRGVPASAVKHRASSNNDNAAFVRGGIDFNTANLNMHIRRDGNGVPLPMGQQDMASLSHLQGLEPVILSIHPAAGLPFFTQLQAASVPAK